MPPPPPPTDDSTLRDAPKSRAAKSTALPVRGEVLDRYLILEELGRGGMGAVYAAWDMDLGRRVALKVLLSDRAGEQDKVRLRREAQAMARLSHPNVVAIHHTGTYERGMFLAMELVDGTTLGAWLKTPRPWRESLRVMIEAGRGLSAAHAAGLVHRDFKPGNVLIAKDGRVLVTDFGVARADSSSSSGEHDSSPSNRVPPGRSSDSGLLLVGPLAGDPPSGVQPKAEGEGAGASPPAPRSSGGDRGSARPLPGTMDLRFDGEDLDGRMTLDERVTREGTILGTLGYMAPEQIHGRRGDARSDQFSFCVTLYRALYGKAAFKYQHALEYLDAVKEPPAPPPAKGPVPSWIWPIVQRGLRREPEERYASMDALLAALEADPTRKRRARIGALLAVVTIALGATGLAAKGRAERASCAAAGQHVFSVWDTASREAVGEVLRAAQVKAGPRMPGDAPDRVLAALDHHAQAWAGVREKACVEDLATRREPAALSARRMACLERGENQLAALVGELRQADETTAPNALHAALSLARPAMCMKPSAGERLLPSDPASRKQLAETEAALSRAMALSMMGKPKEALAEALRAVEAARAQGDARLEAAALYRVSTLQVRVGESQASIDDGLRALVAAERAGDDALVARVAASISQTLVDKMDRSKEAEAWLLLAEAKLARTGSDDDVESDVLAAKALWLTYSDRYHEALPVFERLTAALERVWGPTSERGLSALNNKALALSTLGRLDDALEMHRRAIAQGELLFGPESLDLAVDYQNMALVLIALGRYSEAQTAAQRSYDLRLRLGADSPRLCWPLSLQAGLALRRGEHARALELADRCRALGEGRPSSIRGIVPSVLIHRGDALWALGRFAEAAEACRASLSLIEEDGPMSPNLVTHEPLTCLGVAEIRLGQEQEGLAHLERAVTLLKREEPISLALSRFALARALHGAGRDPERARALAEQARADLQKLGSLPADLAEVERWLTSPFGLDGREPGTSPGEASR